MQTENQIFSAFEPIQEGINFLKVAAPGFKVIVVDDYHKEYNYQDSLSGLLYRCLKMNFKKKVCYIRVAGVVIL